MWLLIITHRFCRWWFKWHVYIRTYIENGMLTHLDILVHLVPAQWVFSHPYSKKLSRWFLLLFSLAVWVFDNFDQHLLIGYLKMNCHRAIRCSLYLYKIKNSLLLYTLNRELMSYTYPVRPFNISESRAVFHGSDTRDWTIQYVYWTCLLTLVYSGGWFCLEMICLE